MPAMTVMACLLGAPAVGQPALDSAPTARIHWGPLRLNPTIGLTNAGIDTNVFNQADVNHPKSDFTMTVTPAADAWLSLGHLSLVASVKEDLVYYREFASERCVNGTYRAAAIVPLNRLSFSVGADYVTARDRPGFEIDARSQYTEAGYHGRLEVRAFGKTFVAATVDQLTVEFDQNALFMGASLQHELSRVLTSAGVAVRHQVTPVTSLTLVVSRGSDRFLYASLRDSTSTRIMGGVKFDTRLHGSASVGYRTLEPRAVDVPGYRGLTASADVSFATVGSTRFGVQVGRDLQYSYDVLQPYYLQTGATVSFTQGLFGPLNGTARIGMQQLAYRGRISLAAPQAERTDLVSLFGGGVGYRVAGDMRVSFNVDRQRRNSDLVGHSYGGLRYGMSVTYGF